MCSRAHPLQGMHLQGASCQSFLLGGGVEWVILWVSGFKSVGIQSIFRPLWQTMSRCVVLSWAPFYGCYTYQWYPQCHCPWMLLHWLPPIRRTVLPCCSCAIHLGQTAEHLHYWGAQWFSYWCPHVQKGSVWLCMQAEGALWQFRNIIHPCMNLCCLNAGYLDHPDIHAHRIAIGSSCSSHDSGDTFRWWSTLAVAMAWFILIVIPSC